MHQQEGAVHKSHNYILNKQYFIVYEIAQKIMETTDFEANLTILQTTVSVVLAWYETLSIF